MGALLQRVKDEVSVVMARKGYRYGKKFHKSCTDSGKATIQR